MTAVSVQTPAPVSASRRPSSAFRLLWLYLRSRRVPSAVAALAACAAFLWSALAYHWTVGSAGPGATELPMMVEACAAAAIAVTSHGPFGEPERATGRWLPWFRFWVPLALCGTAIGLFMLAAMLADAPATAGTSAAAGQGGPVGSPAVYLVGGILPVVRNVFGMTAIGLVLSLVTGGLLAWIGPLAFMGISQFTLVANYETPLTWPARPPHDRGAWICAAVVFAAGMALFTVRGPRTRVSDDA